MVDGVVGGADVLEELLVGLYEIVKPALLEAERQYTRSTQSIVDYPTVRILRQSIADLEEQERQREESVLANAADLAAARRQLGQQLAAAFAEDPVLLSVVTAEVAHVLDDAEHLKAGLLCHVTGSLRDLLASSGVDVSGWQGQVDWGAVQRSGRMFAFAKATEGATFVDRTFAVNRAVEPLMRRFIDGEIDAVHVAYMNFISTGVQKAEVAKFLPLASVTEVTDQIARQVAEKESQAQAGSLAGVKSLLPG